MIKRELLLSAAGLAIAMASPAHAQTAPTAEPNAQSTTDAEDALSGQGDSDIVVVGTQIQGSQVTAALPVTIVDQAQIINTGALSGDELFRSIPQMGDVSFNSTYLPNSSNSARGDIGSVNLRNLGVGNTLVLLNGRRVVNHPTSRADDNLVPVLTYNTNTIPVFGLERLEVLRDGAAAIYGSDAVAGVVNTVLKSNFTGVQLEGQLGFSEDTNLSETNLNGLFGMDLGDRGNITFYASYDRRTMQRAAEEAYTASADKRPLFVGSRFDINGVVAIGLDGRSTITPWGSFQTLGNVVVRAGTATNSPLVTNASGQFHIQPVANGGCSATVPGSAICVDDGTNGAVADRNLRFDAPLAFNTSVYPKVERANFFANGHYDLTDNLTFFTEAGYYVANTQSIQSSTGTLASGPLVIPASNFYNPFGAVGTANRLPGINAPAAGLAVTLSSYNFADLGPNIVDVENTQYRVLGGLRFEALGFRWETAGVYSEARVTDISDGISQTLLQRQLALNTPDAYNPFNGGSLTDPSGRDGNPSSAAAINAIRIKTRRFSKATMALGDIKGSTNSLFALPAGDVGVAIGAEIRRETQLDDRDPRVDGSIQFTDSVNGVVSLADLVGSSPSEDARNRRTVVAAYAELAVPVIGPDMNVPLIERLEVQLAGRFENYSDVGSVAKPKIAAAWDIVRGLRVRASYAEGFKAPNLEQISAQIVTRSNTRQDPIRCEAGLRQPPTIPNPTPGGPPLANPRYIATFGACSQSFATSAQRSGNPDLKPETSTNWSVGVVLQPYFLEDAIGRVTITVDYWNIKQQGIVGIFGEGNALINDYLLRVGGQTDSNVIRAAPTADEIELFAGTGLAPAGRVLFVRDQYVNLLPQQADGVDIGFNWRMPDFGMGRFTLNANAAYLDTFFLQPSSPIQALIDARAAGTINAGVNIADAGDRIRQNGKPQWKATGSLTWEKGPFQIGGYTAYTGDVEDTGLIDSAGVPFLIEDQMTFNLYGQISIGNEREGEYRIRIGARNLTDESPPLSSDGYLGSISNPYGRYWYANVRTSF